MENRLEYLNKLSKYIHETNDNISYFKTEFGWRQKSSLTGPKRSDERNQNEPAHLSEEPDETFPESAEDSRNTIHFDKELQMKVLSEPEMTPLVREVPQSYKDFVLNFSREERLAMYDYVIDQTGHFEQPEATFLFQPDNEEKPKRQMTLTEIMALQKRRRTKYRISKNLPFSYTEEIRNLITDQMEVLQEHLRCKSGSKLVEESKETEKRRKKKKHKRERSQERDQPSSKRKHKEHKRSRSRSRKRSRQKSPDRHHHKKHKSRN